VVCHLKYELRQERRAAQVAARAASEAIMKLKAEKAALENKCLDLERHVEDLLLTTPWVGQTGIAKQGGRQLETVSCLHSQG